MSRAVHASTSTRGSALFGLQEPGTKPTLVVSSTVVADVLQALGERINELLVEQADAGYRVVVSVNGDNFAVLALAVLEEGLARLGVELLEDVSCVLPPFSVRKAETGSSQRPQRQRQASTSAPPWTRQHPWSGWLRVSARHLLPHGHRSTEDTPQIRTWGLDILLRMGMGRDRQM